MIRIEHVVTPSPEQMKFVIEGMRNAMNSWDKSDSVICKYGLDCDSCESRGEAIKCNEFYLGEEDYKLMKRLVWAGSDERKFMRMMPVYVRITAPLYWWKEFDTYKIGTVANSCSTMHKISEKEFTLEDFSYEHLIVENDVNYIDMIGWLQKQITILNEWRLTYLDVKNSPTSSESAKTYWWQMIQLLPSSYNQTRNVMLNYEVLMNMYHARKNHKLDEWRIFCEWIENRLPWSDLITLGCLKKKMNVPKTDRSKKNMLE